MSETKVVTVASPHGGSSGISENDDLMQTILATHGQLQALLARRGGRMPINVYMALCYLQAEITGRANPRSVESLWPGGNNAKAV